MTDGVGNRAVSKTKGDPETPIKSTGGLSQDLLDLGFENFQKSLPVRQKPVCLLADSMGQCIPVTDSVIQATINEKWSFTAMEEDVRQGKVLVEAQNVIVWAGAHHLKGHLDERISEDLVKLCQVLHSKKQVLKIFISAILPQPRQHHQVAGMIQVCNDLIQETVLNLQQQGLLVQFLATHQLYLDHNRDIVRPITENFEDGFHLNLHGAHRLRQFWLKQLGLSK